VEGEVMRELERRFPPEFRNRIDEVVLFAPLTHDEVREIARHYLHQVTLTLAKAGKTIAISDEALETVVAKGYSIAFGARFLKRFIDEQIKLPISARWKDGSHFEVTVGNGQIAVEPRIAKALSPDEAIAFGDVV
jgi:ATP-dependent Clp protease ATP-binding subunit ClpC